MNANTLHCLTLCTCALLASCATPATPSPAKPKSRAEAAGVLISVNSVAPWSQVANALQPNFTITGDSALAQVAPTTARINEQVLRAFGMTAGIGLPQLSRQATSKTTSQGSPQTGITTTIDNSATSTTQPGSIPQPPTGAPAGTEPLERQPDISGNIDIDPLLKYQAALSLYQAVTLMNQQVQSVVSNKCYTPYLVQMKIAVMPYRQHLPFDLHTTISFFPEVDGLNPSGHFPSTTEKSVGAQAGNTQAAAKCEGTMPRVVPVLIADNIEKAVRQNALETARQIGFAINSMLSGIGGNVGINQLNQSIKDLLGQDINSRFTVARLVDNTIYVRIGAATQASSGKSLIGQTYDVALVLLVPSPYNELLKISKERAIQVVTTSEFRDIETGATLSGQSETVNAADTVFHEMGDADLLNAWSGQDIKQKASVIGKLLISVSSGDYFRDADKDCPAAGNLNFECTLKTIELTFKDWQGKEQQRNLLELVKFPPLLWSRMTPLLVDSPFKTASFDLPDIPEIRVTPSSQTVLLQDDTKDTTTVTIQGISISAPQSISASLKLHDPDRKRDYVLPAVSASIDQHTNALSLGFPSLAMLGIANFDPQTSKLLIEPANCAAASSSCPRIANGQASLEFPLLYFPDGAPTPGQPSFDFTSKQAAIISASGKSTAIVQVSNIKGDDVVISSDNAYIESATDGQGKSLPVVDGKIKITKPQKIAVQLNGVISGMLVNLTATGEKKGKDDVKKSIRFVVVTK